MGGGRTEVKQRTATAEFRLLAVLGLPLMGAYLAEIGMYLTTKVVVGRLGHVELAAVGLTAELIAEIQIVVIGLLSILGVMIAEADGVDDRLAAAQRCRQGFLFATVLAVPVTLLAWNMGHLLGPLGQAPEVIPLGTEFAKGAAGSVLPLLWFTAGRNFVAALGQSRIVLLATVLAVVLNLLFAYALVLGNFGLPALGAFGAGLATTLATWSMPLVLLVHLLRNPHYRAYPLWQGTLRFDVALMRRLVQQGLQVGGLVLMESGMFAALGILMGLFGPVVLAAGGIAISWAALGIVVPLGLAEAVMLRVARARGNGNFSGMRLSGLLGLGTGGFCIALFALVPVFFPETVVGIFLEETTSARGQVLELAKGFFLIAAVFAIFDALQIIATRALRGMLDTRVPFFVALVGYWGLGIGGGSYLAFVQDLGAKGLWLGLAAGLVMAGLILTKRFLVLTDLRTAPA